MINIFSHTFLCRTLGLEYSEHQAIEDFDISLPLTEGVISGLVAERYPELVTKLRQRHDQDRRAGIMIDRYSSEVNAPSLVTFGDPYKFFEEWGVEGVVDENQEYYAAVVYLGRENLVRVVYRNADNPSTKTDVYDGGGSFSHHEEIYTGSLPESLEWANAKLMELKDLGINARINHFKDNGKESKVYFLVESK